MEINKCDKQNHEGNPFNFLCIDPSCQVAQKYACLGCLVFFHPQHQILHYEDIYKIINQGSNENSQNESQILQEFIESRRQINMVDVNEVVYLLDMVQFPQIYNNNAKGDDNKPSKLKQLKSQYEAIKQKPFHGLNSHEMNILQELIKVQNSTKSNNKQSNEQSIQEKKENINKILSNNKKNIINFINCYAEYIEEGKEPKSYREALDQLKELETLKNYAQKQPVNTQQIETLNKQITQLKSENSQLKEQNDKLSKQNDKLMDEVNVSNVKISSIQHINDELKSRLAQSSKNAETQNQVTRLQKEIEILKSEISTSQNKQNNLQKAYNEQKSEVEELKEVLVRARIALEIYQIKFKQLTEQVEQNKRESIIANLRASILAAENDERRKQEIRRQQAQSGRVEVTECNVQ